VRLPRVFSNEGHQRLEDEVLVPLVAAHALADGPVGRERLRDVALGAVQLHAPGGEQRAERVDHAALLPLVGDAGVGGEDDDGLAHLTEAPHVRAATESWSIEENMSSGHEGPHRRRAVGFRQVHRQCGEVGVFLSWSRAVTA
jgi:hypothetical protein